MELMGNQTTNFFTTLAPEFTELYGRGGNVTAEQKQSRETLALMGDQIRNGARSQGIDMPVHESLEQANMQFAMPFVAEQQRKELTAKVERRSASRTFQPTQRGRMTRSAPAPRSDEAAMEAMNEHANTLGWKWQQ